MNDLTKRILLTAGGIILSVVPVAISIILYFPLWLERGDGSVVSGFAVLLLALAAIPVFKLCRRVIASPSAWMMWLLLLIVFLATSRIADEMIVISFIGLVGGAVGAVLFNIAKKYK